MGVVVVGELPSLTGGSLGETHRALECTHTHHLRRNQHQKGPIFFWVAGDVTESQHRAEQEALYLFNPSPLANT